MTPAKEKAKELVDKMYNTEHCGIQHIPNKNYCDCTEINYYQAKQCALKAVDEMLEFTKRTEKSTLTICTPDGCYCDETTYYNDYLIEVKNEIENNDR